MTDNDNLRRFVFDAFPVRGQIVHLDAAWRAVLERHDYPETVRPLLGEALAATVLMASTLKFAGRMTLQLHGDGPLHLLVVQCTDTMRVRALARWKEEVRAGSFREQVGNGRLAITIETEGRPRPYQGVVPLTGDTLDDCLTAYFDTSEQLPTRIWLAADDDRAAGLLLQRLPATRPDSDEDDDWRRVQLLAETLSETDELLQLAHREMLSRLFNEDDVRLTDARAVHFRCTCSPERIETMLRALGEDELQSILEEQGEISVACEFCNRERSFDAVDVARLLAGAVAPGRQSVH